MQAPAQLAQILYEIAMDIGGSTERDPMLTRALRTLLRRLSGFGAIVLAQQAEEEGVRHETVFVLPRNILRNENITEVVNKLINGADTGLALTDWTNPQSMSCNGFLVYRLDLPSYGILLLFKAHPLDPDISRALKRICEKLAEACIACDNARALAESRERLRVTFDAIGDAIIVTDPAGLVIRMNPVAESLTGWSLSDARMRPLSKVFRIINRDTRRSVDSPVNKVIESGEVAGLANHTILLSRDGTEHQISDSGAPIRNRDGEIVGVVLVFRDVTDEYALQEQLHDIRQMDAIGQLASGIAHEFNNMLGGIIGAADVLKTYLNEDPTALQFHQAIVDSANRAADLTRQLLAFARRHPLTRESLDIHQLLTEVMALLQRTIDKRVTIDTEFTPHDVHATGDRSQLHSVFLNLGINAWHAMPNGGTITVSTRHVNVDETFCQSHGIVLEPGRYADIEVRDTGVGIARRDLPHIFEPFLETRDLKQNTGLGLSAAQATVQQHQGTIWAYSQAGRGSCFHVLLPSCDPAPRETTGMSQPARGAGNILIVDDEPVMRTTSKAILELLGYTVVLADSGEMGLDVLRKQHEKLDLVLLDMLMPGMNGRECFRAMKAVVPDIRIVMTSGYFSEEDLGELNDEGLAGFIRKPFNQHRLSQVIADTLAREP